MFKSHEKKKNNKNKMYTFKIKNSPNEPNLRNPTFQWSRKKY